MSSLSHETFFPAVWDNTMLSTASDCQQKANWQFFHHLRPNTPNINLHAGATFARAVEHVRLHVYPPSGKDPVAEGAKAAIREWGDFECDSSHVKALPRVLGALDSYVKQYNPETDHVKPLMLNGKPCVEFSFAHPLDILHPETGEPLIYCGRFDMLGVLNGDESCLFVEDEKTTTQLGPTWPKQWGLRSQFMGYVWGAKKFGHPVVGAIVRGISFLKGGYGHAEAIVYFPDWMIQRWYEQVHIKLELLIHAWRHNRWTFNFSTSCSSYGGCAYRMLCETETPERWLNPYYTVAPWDPMRLREGAD